MFKSLTTLVLSAVTASTLLLSSNAVAAHTAPSQQIFFAVQLDGQLNINTASQKQLELLPGIGPATAKKVLDYRAKRPFKETVHLIRVKGIGRKTFDKIKGYLSVKGETTLQAVGKKSKK